MTTRLWALWAAVPTPVPPPGSDRGEEFGKTSPIALVVVILLGIATALLIRSMNKRLRNVPASFDPPDDAPDGATPGREAEQDGPTDAGGAASGAPTSVDRSEGPPRTGSP